MANRNLIKLEGPVQYTLDKTPQGRARHTWLQRTGATLVVIEPANDEDWHDDDTLCPTCGHSGGSLDYFGRMFHPECVDGFMIQR